MEHLGRTVIGYHGCLEPFASELLTGDRAIEDWVQSQNDYDWLGHGIYFWEHAPSRALEWALDKAKRTGPSARPAVVGAIISLAGCLDLTDTKYTSVLRKSFDDVSSAAHAREESLPKNAGLRRPLDCLVINSTADLAPGEIKSVRCPFLEGGAAFAGSAISAQGHIQIAVRDRVCILGLFRPNLPLGGNNGNQRNTC